MVDFVIAETLYNIQRVKKKCEIKYINCTFGALTI